MSLFNELKRRNVIRVAMAYVVVAWLIIQVVETILPAFGYSDVAIRYVVIVLAILFIPTLVFSWAFEVTPEGLKREVDVVREHSITRFTGKKLDRIIMVLLALALGYFAFDKFVLDPAEDIQIAESAHQEGRSEALTESFGDKSIAVLPFVNMSDDAGNEYFSDGISEELLNLLSKIPDLRVISRSSSFSFKGKDFDIPTIARQLNVAHILEGSVRKAGNQVRITAQLIDARTDTHLWSQTYDRELANIFVVQDEISAAITGALKERLGLQLDATPMATAITNAEAHDAYLRGRHLVVQRTKATIEGAIREFEKAVVLDPEYALAHAELAIANILLSLHSDLMLSEAIATAAPHAELAMILDPKLAEAYAANGLLLKYEDNFEDALVNFRRAIQINANYSIAHTWMANTLTLLGHYKEAFAMRESILRLNPLSMVATDTYTQALMVKNLPEDAERVLEKIASIYPVHYAVRKSDLTAIGGNWANLVLGYLDALRLEPDNHLARVRIEESFALIGLGQEAITISEPVEAFTLMMLGRTEDAATVAQVGLPENLTPPLSFFIAYFLGSAGDYARARPMLEEAWQWHNGRVTQNAFQVVHAAALIAIRHDAGDEAGVDEILAAIRDNVRRYREAGFTNAAWYVSPDYEEGLAAYLAGERERGLALIAKAADEGFFILPNEAYLQMLYDDPGFAPIRAAQEARQARERNRFFAIVCNDNPYEEVWKPAEGTCERFAAEGVVIEP